MTNPQPAWFRLTVDLSHDGEWRGSSYEVRHDDRIVGIHVMPEPGPFEHGMALLEAMIEEVEARYGVQLRLL